MRFLCLWVEHLPARVETLLDPDLATKPVVLLRAWDERVLDASPDVIAAGIGMGDSRRRVEQVAPQAVILPAREPIYQAHHDRLKALQAGFVGAIECAALGEFFIEVGTLARAFPSDKALGLHVAMQAQRDTRLLPGVGIASNKFTASWAAREAVKESSRALVVPDGHERRFLESFPLTALPDPPAELLRRLHLFGITTLGGIAKLPYGAFVRQFGSGMGVFHTLANGIDPRPLAPQSPPPSIVRTFDPPEAIAERRMVLAALEHLAGGLARSLNQSGHHALAVSLTVTLDSDCELTTGAPLKPPSADAEALRRLAGRLLGKLTIDAGVSRLALTAYPLREWHVGARQLEMFAPAIQPKLARLQEAIRVLARRFGEAIFKLASALGPPLPLPIHVQAQASGLPAWLSFGGYNRRIASIYEYWREDFTWWERPASRDYYQVMLPDETILTVFHDEKGRWYLDRRKL